MSLGHLVGGRSQQRVNIMYFKTPLIIATAAIVLTGFLTAPAAAQGCSSVVSVADCEENGRLGARASEGSEINEVEKNRNAVDPAKQGKGKAKGDRGPKGKGGKKAKAVNAEDFAVLALDSISKKPQQSFSFKDLTGLPRDASVLFGFCKPWDG